MSPRTRGLVRCLDWTWLYLTRYGKGRRSERQSRHGHFPFGGFAL